MTVEKHYDRKQRTETIRQIESEDTHKVEGSTGEFGRHQSAISTQRERTSDLQVVDSGSSIESVDDHTHTHTRARARAHTHMGKPVISIDQTARDISSEHTDQTRKTPVISTQTRQGRHQRSAHRPDNTRHQ